MPIQRSAGTDGADVFSATCPSRRVLELVANKWSLLVITALRGAPMRNNDLLRKIGGISQKMLTQTLRELERSGLVLRADRETVPPHVEYSLTPVGSSLSDVLVHVDHWAEANHHRLRRIA